MKHKHLRIVIVFGSIVLFCLFVVQLYWFKRAFDVAERQFDHSVQVALKEVADSITSIGEAGTEVRKLSSGFFFVAANSNLNFKTVDTLVKREFLLRNLNIDYELGIYNAHDDTLVYGNYINATKRRLIEKEFLATPTLYAEKNFAIYFPKKKSHLAAELQVWIFSTLVLMLMTGFFAYAIFSLLRERKFSELKNDFINNMTHELKTPVTNIKIVSEVLKSRGDGELAYLNILDKESTKLQQKIEQVLSASMGDNLRKTKFGLVDLHEILEQCAEAFKWKVMQRNGSIQLAFNAKQFSIEGDKELLIQALSNVIDNAEKYAREEPGILLETSDGVDGIEVRIKDNGVGIPRDQQSKVFDKFFRVKTGNVHDVKGFGLGLNFVKNVIRAHKGKILLRSEPDNGTEVSIYFPKA